MLGSFAISRVPDRLMDEPGDLPRLPADQLESPLGDISELKPGEQAVLSVSLDIEADEAGHLWVDVSRRVRRLPVVAGLTLLAQRTERAFILWLDKRVKFMGLPLPSGRRYLPVVELRDAQED